MGSPAGIVSESMAPRFLIFYVPRLAPINSLENPTVVQPQFIPSAGSDRCIGMNWKCCSNSINSLSTTRMQSSGDLQEIYFLL